MEVILCAGCRTWRFAMLKKYTLYQCRLVELYLQHLAAHTVIAKGLLVYAPVTVTVAAFNCPKPGNKCSLE